MTYSLCLLLNNLLSNKTWVEVEWISFPTWMLTSPTNNKTFLQSLANRQLTNNQICSPSNNSSKTLQISTLWEANNNNLFNSNNLLIYLQTWTWTHSNSLSHNNNSSSNSHLIMIHLDSIPPLLSLSPNLSQTNFSLKTTSSSSNNKIQGLEVSKLLLHRSNNNSSIKTRLSGSRRMMLGMMVQDYLI